jgi:SAM-dependent methyltransferase
VTGSIATHRDDWDRHWDAFSEANERNPAQAYRRRLAIDLLGRQGPPRRLLDIGSGQGDFLALAAAHWPKAELLGLEISDVGVEVAAAKVPRARFRTRDLLSDSSPEGDEAAWATHALCSEVLEHVDDPVSLLRNTRPYLAPGCRMVVTVPGGPMSAFDRHIGHRRHLGPADLASVIREAGLEVEHATGAGFPFFNLYRLAVIMRGRRLVEDFAAGGTGSEARLARAAMVVFDALFRLNLPRGNRGWQTVALARRRGSGDASDAD